MDINENIIISKSILNDVIMESLLIDGHADIASIFAEESGIDIPSIALESAKKRSDIIQYIRNKELYNLVTNKEIMNKFSLTIQLLLHQQYVVDELLVQSSNIKYQQIWNYWINIIPQLTIIESSDQAIVEETALLFLYLPITSSSTFTTTTTVVNEIQKLYSNDHRQQLIQIINEYLLQIEGLRTTSRLPTLLRIFLHYNETNYSMSGISTTTSSSSNDQIEPLSNQIINYKELIRQLLSGGIPI